MAEVDKKRFSHDANRSRDEPRRTKSEADGKSCRILKGLQARHALEPEDRPRWRRHKFPPRPFLSRRIGIVVSVEELEANSVAKERKMAPSFIATAIASVVLVLLTQQGVLARGPLPADLPSEIEIRAALDTAYTQFKDLKEGANADYIPALAKVDPNIYGIALVTADGQVYTEGDVTSEVSIQSISKVLTMAKVLEQQDASAVVSNIGVNATGQAFNSIVAIEKKKGLEQNPLVNPGAITATSMVCCGAREEIWNALLSYYSDFAGRQLSVNQEVYRSESDTNQRNQAIAKLMYAYERIKSDPDVATSIYTEQCSVNVNAKDLAEMAATLANGGVNPVTHKKVLEAKHVPQVLAVMATAGLYDNSGDWLFKTGLPAKSGVGGGIIAVAPGKFGIAVVSPPLDSAGNSVKAQKTIEAISNALGGNPYAIAPR
jgi:glutaminase